MRMRMICCCTLARAWFALRTKMRRRRRGRECLARLRRHERRWAMGPYVSAVLVGGCVDGVSDICMVISRP